MCLSAADKLSIIIRWRQKSEKEALPHATKMRRFVAQKRVDIPTSISTSALADG
jgi:hypothetical protein